MIPEHLSCTNVLHGSSSSMPAGSFCSPAYTEAGCTNTCKHSGCLLLLSRQDSTKGLLIERDIDLLTSISMKNPAICELTITTYQDQLSKKIEPHAPVSSKRFKTLSTLSNAGLFAGIVLMPVLPFIGDNENNILEIVKRAADSGAKFIYPYFGVTLRHNQREYYYNKLDSIFPDMNYLIKYKSVYGESYECVVPNHEELELLFQEKCNHYGILYRMSDIIREYQTAYDLKQLSLFDFIPE